MLAAEGMTIICTIHQPNSETFEIFDKVVLIQSYVKEKSNLGGISMWRSSRYEMHCFIDLICSVGYIGSPPEAVHFFASVNHLIPEHSNPANFFIQVF